MSTLAPEPAAAEEVDGHVCPECGETFKFAMHLGGHRKREHGVEGKTPKRERRGRTPRATAPGPRGEINRLRRDLKKAVLALSLFPFMAKGTADRLTSQEITQVLDDRAQEFADAWVAVAEQNPMVRQWLTVLLQGGVWINAGVQTAAFGYTLAVFAGYTPLHPASLMVLPDMRQFVVAPVVPAGSNGGAPGGPESPANE